MMPIRDEINTVLHAWDLRWKSMSIQESKDTKTNYYLHFYQIIRQNMIKQGFLIKSHFRTKSWKRAMCAQHRCKYDINAHKLALPIL